VRVQAAVSSGCSSQYCTGGTPTCDTGFIGYATAADSPVAVSLFDSGYVETVMMAEAFYRDGTGFWVGSGAAEVYGPYALNSAHDVPPGPIDAVEAGFLAAWVYFAWYDPSQQAWTDWYCAAADGYHGQWGDTQLCMTG
jgi:hypothetical protein